MPRAYWSGLSSSTCSVPPDISTNMPNRRESVDEILSMPSQYPSMFCAERANVHRRSMNVILKRHKCIIAFYFEL